MGVELIREILGSAAGSLGFVLSLLLLAGWLIYRITKYTTEWNCKLNAVKDLSENLKTAREDILYIKTKLEIFSSNMPNGLTQSHSPIGLSEIFVIILRRMPNRKTHMIFNSYVLSRLLYHSINFSIQKLLIK